jgi:hypothetical protein
MGRGIGFISLILALAVGAYLYSKQSSDITPGGGTPMTAIDLTGVRMDLIANAERTHFSTNGKYASLNELRANGDTQITRDSRPNFTYSAETSDSGFTIIANYSGPDPNAPKRLSIDETLTVRTD